MTEGILACKRCKQRCRTIREDVEENGGRPWDMCIGCRWEVASEEFQMARADKAEARVAELERAALDSTMQKLAEGPRPSESDIEKLVAEARRLRAQVAEIQACEVGLQKVLHRRTEKLGSAQTRVAELESLNGFIQAQKISEFLDLRVGSQLVESAKDKIEKLNKVHFAACRHLEAMGACDDTGDHDDESHAEVFGCTYCNLDRAASAVDEKQVLRDRIRELEDDKNGEVD